MKDGLNALYERRSVRKYKSEQISDGELEQILKAGLCAPSAMNRQPAIIIAVQDKGTIAYMSKLNAQVMGSPCARQSDERCVRTRYRLLLGEPRAGGFRFGRGKSTA